MLNADKVQFQSSFQMIITIIWIPDLNSDGHNLFLSTIWTEVYGIQIMAWVTNVFELDLFPPFMY